jgi:hypothetical protein
MAMTKEQSVEVLKNGIAKLSTSEAFLEYLTFSAKFHQYSLHNALLIMAQTQGKATAVAGFNKWRDEFGRFVKKGETGLAIWAPLFKKEERADGTKRDALIGFRVVYVFDVNQTEGKPLPERVAPRKLLGEDGGLYDVLAQHVTDSGLTLEVKKLDGENGHYSKLEKAIRIEETLPSALQRFKTLAHEVAHWKLHSDEQGEALTRSAKETEAEAAAFLVLAHFGFRADEYSFAYIADWTRGNLQTLEKSLARIKRGADAVIEAIESRLPEVLTAADVEAAIA